LGPRRHISSVHGRVASPYKSAYVAAKHGLEGLSKVIALEGAARGLVVRATDPAFSLENGCVYDDASLSPAGRAFVELLDSLEPPEPSA